MSVANSGSGYVSNPIITFAPPVGGGTSATGIGYINSAGNITDIYLIHAGTGYTTGDIPGAINIETPSGIGATIGVGTYLYNEIVIGSSSSTTARVNNWDNPTKVLEIKIVWQ